jgi:DNA-binding protein YbaB
VIVSAELERLAAEFEKFQAKIQQVEVKFSGIGEMRDQLERLEAVVTSPDRTVRVVAGAGGTVLDLQLTPEAMRRQAPELAATIMTTLRAAVAEAVRRQAGIVDETVGDAFGVNASDRVREAQAEALRNASEELTAHHTRPATPPKRPVRAGDDDFSQKSVYRQQGRQR